MNIKVGYRTWLVVAFDPSNFSRLVILSDHNSYENAQRACDRQKGQTVLNIPKEMLYEDGSVFRFDSQEKELRDKIMGLA